MSDMELKRKCGNGGLMGDAAEFDVGGSGSDCCDCCNFILHNGFSLYACKRTSQMILTERISNVEG